MTGARWVRVAITVALVGGFGAFAVVPPAMAGTGSIAGTVTDGSSPVPGIVANAYDGFGAWAGVDQTDAFGAYAIGGLDSGDYRVEFSDPDDGFFTEWYDDAADLGTATTITVVDGVATTEIDAVLAPTAIITGTVTDPSLTPLDGIRVTVYDASQAPVADPWYTGPDGTYRVAGLASGGYRIEFWEGTGAFFAEWYDDAADFASATVIPAVVGTPVSGIDAQLAPAAAISGTVTEEISGILLSGINVNVYDAGQSWMGGAVTEADGTYLVDGLYSGEYRVRFVENSGMHFEEWYDDAADFATAASVVATEGATTGGIDAELTLGGSIAGTVTDAGGSPLAGITVTVYDSTHMWAGSKGTGAGGSFSIGGLATGDYFVRYADSSETYAAEWYDDAATIGTATWVPVTQSLVTSGINARLTTGGSISGTVTGIGGDPLVGIEVAVFELGEFEVDSVLTGTGGGFLVGGLATGDYRVRFTDPGGTYLTEWYDDASDFATATAVAVVEGSVTTAINAALQLSEPVERLWGVDRFGTAVAVSGAAFPGGADVAYVAYGFGFPDALAGGVAAATEGGPLLLVRSDSVPASTAAELVRLGVSRVVILGGTGVVADSVATELESVVPGVVVERLWGVDRFGTAVAVSGAAFPGGADVAYVAYGFGFPDALAGGVAAATEGGPLLLVRSDSVPASTAAELVRLGVSRVVILGGTGVVADSVVTELESVVPGVVVERLWGVDRFGTAVAVSGAAFPGGADVAYVAYGFGFPDALAGGVAAATEGGPLLLVRSDSVPASTASELVRLGVSVVVVLGGTGVIADTVITELEALLGP